MALESATYIDDFVTTNPVVGDQGKTLADHIWLVKTVLQTTFPNIDGAVSGTPAELNYLAGVTAGTSAASKALVLDSSSNLSSGTLNNLTAAGTVTADTLTDGTASLSSGTATSLTLTSPVVNTGVSGTAIDTDSSMAADSDTLLASQKAIKAAIAANPSTVKQIQINNAYSNSVLSTSETTRVTVTLSDVEAGSSILLFAVANFYTSDVAGHCYLAITDGSDTMLNNSGNYQDCYVYAANESANCSTMAVDASPGTGSQNYKLRARDSSGMTGYIANATLVAIEFEN